MRLVTGILATTLVVSNLIINSIPLFVMGLIRGAAHLAGTRQAEARIARAMNRVIDSWVVINRFLFRLLRLTRVDIQWSGDADLSRDRWYAVVSNHQTWPDIFILQTMLFERIPPLKFFTKRQLLWIPFFGQAMWLLDFPYVRRMSREQIAANPALLAVDRRSTLQACQIFRRYPTSVLNFLEGTRFTAEKYAALDNARFTHLLNPKTGGLATVLRTLDDRLHKLLDITIDYPGGVPSFWDFMRGLSPAVTMRVTCHDIPEDIRTAADDETHRRLVSEWVESLWVEKDRYLAESRAAPAPGIA